jgi:2-polyprenyl-3-methyl-5-hydroxy-6-metoxy-1,4-benzoquinol methylase
MNHKSTVLKETSFAYQNYQEKQAEKYRNRESNHWKIRIDLATRLFEKYALPRLGNKQKSEIIVVDVACSIGTFAIEFARHGYRSFGVDFDSEALKIAEQLASEEGVNPQFVHADISEWSLNFPKIDVVVCMDVFEHLHDDELGAMLQSIRKQMAEKSALVFHTFPTQYDYLFNASKGRYRYPLLPFRKIKPNTFTRLTRAYAALLDAWWLLRTGKNRREMIKKKSHCNPLTKERLEDIAKRAGFGIEYIELAQLYPNDLFTAKPGIQNKFIEQPISFRNLSGVLVPQPTAREIGLE